MIGRLSNVSSEDGRGWPSNTHFVHWPTDTPELFYATNGEEKWSLVALILTLIRSLWAFDKNKRLHNSEYSTRHARACTTHHRLCLSPFWQSNYDTTTVPQHAKLWPVIHWVCHLCYRTKLHIITSTTVTQTFVLSCPIVRCPGWTEINSTLWLVVHAHVLDLVRESKAQIWFLRKHLTRWNNYAGSDKCSQ